MLNKIRKVQDDLSAIQVELAKASEEHELELLDEVDTGDAIVELETNQQGLKLTVYVVPPKISIYRYVTFENGNFTNRQHKEARDYWYSIIKRALADQVVEPIKPAIVYIRYFLDKNCDVGNFLSKFIQDGLVYNGILEDDDLDNVTLLAEGKLKKEKAPRTEIYVVHDDGKISDMITSQFDLTLDDEITLNVVKDIAKLKDDIDPEITRVVFKDNGFQSDADKTNAIEMLKQYGIEEVMSI